MFFIRYLRASSSSTSQASADAIKLLSDPKFKVAVFSMSPAKDDGTAKPGDGSTTNWPYFSAAIRVDDDVHIFDAPLLNAARIPRDREVRDILDVAQNNANVYFTSDEAAFFTVDLSPNAAAQHFCNRPVTALTPNTRSQFWLKLSKGIPEADLDRIRRS